MGANFSVVFVVNHGVLRCRDDIKMYSSTKVVKKGFCFGPLLKVSSSWSKFLGIWGYGKCHEGYSFVPNCRWGEGCQTKCTRGGNYQDFLKWAGCFYVIVL